jgi:hypothetical protein
MTISRNRHARRPTEPHSMEVRVMRSSRVTVMAAAVAAACSGAKVGSQGAGMDTSVMTLVTSCAETRCERQQRLCEEAQDSQCDACYEACSSLATNTGNVSCLSTCSDICSSSDCYDSCAPDSPCVATSFEFVLPAERDEMHFAACERYRQHVSECLGEPLDEPCDHYARVERPETAAAYDCVAAQSCPTLSLSDCVGSLPPGTLGSEDCSVRLRCGWECPEESREVLDFEHRFLRPDAADALRLCFQQPTCDDYARCTSAWAAAIWQ